MPISKEYYRAVNNSRFTVPAFFSLSKKLHFLISPTPNNWSNTFNKSQIDNL